MRKFRQIHLPLQEPDIKRLSWVGQACDMDREGGRQREVALGDLFAAIPNPSRHLLSHR